MEIHHFRKRKNWLAMRRKFVGASDSFVIAGLGFKSQSVMTVYDSKLSDEDPEPETREMAIGRASERFILELYGDDTGTPVKPTRGHYPYELCVSKSVPFAAATPDGWTQVDGDLVPFEAKCIQYSADEWGEDSYPLRYWVQVQWQLLVAEAPVGILCGWNPQQRSLHTFRIERDSEFMDAFLPKVQDFWQCVLDRRLPVVDGSEATARAIGRLFRQEESGLCVPLAPESAAWMQQRAHAMELMKLAEEKKRQAESQLKLMMGTAEYGAIGDGRYLRWATTHRKESVVKATSYRTLRTIKSLPKGVTYDDTIEDHTESTSGIETTADDPSGFPRIAVD